MRSSNHPNVPAEDPISWVCRALIKAHSLWLKMTYPFERFGTHVSIHYSCDIRRSHAHKIRIEDDVILHPRVWLNVPLSSSTSEPSIIVGKGCNLGRGSVITARNQVHIHENVLFGPSVFITDHNHEYSDPTAPIIRQGVTPGGRIIIEENSWFGYGSMILAKRGTVVVGRNSVVGAYAVVTESCPPYSIVVGNPARVVRQFDPTSQSWAAPKCQDNQIMVEG
jgi:acetyltransferase-like isoleucine patch superfamily enzyme